MSALKILVDLLQEDSTVAAEIYPVVSAQNAQMPLIIVNLVFEEQTLVISHAQPWFLARVRVACHAASAAEVNALGEAVKRSLENTIARELMDGESPPQPWAEATIWKDGFDTSDHDDGRTVFRRIIDFQCRWKRLQ